ncbi:quinone oxidoreductase PIG3 [Megalops cyprinoides]|uniref:quinone oxidoreductase PIG3 n=1 Tax=Megalops cyprinoides TaxID=118141 RepID=UPI00186533D0|nr:quinone oxidoreductase PIG3 [Megalops cyprinoides]
MLAVCVDAPGGPENLLLRTVPRPELKDGEVLVRVRATALNRADLLQRRGLYPAPPGASDILGLEAAGVVAEVGPGVNGCWRPGDRVMALLSGGGYAEFVAVPKAQLMPIPCHLTFQQAAAIPEAWVTAYQLLHLVGRVQPGDTVLVHAAASGVGTAAIQLARLAGAVPIATAGTPEKLKKAEELGAAAGINYRQEDFSEETLRYTEGRGAEVILDCIAGANWEKNVACLAADGRWVLYGKLGGGPVNGDLLGKLLSKRGQLLSSLLRSRSPQYKAELVQSFVETALPHFSPDADPALRPVIDSVFTVERVADAHRHMEANRNIGKIILEFPATEG